MHTDIHTRLKFPVVDIVGEKSLSDGANLSGARAGVVKASKRVNLVSRVIACSCVRVCDMHVVACVRVHVYVKRSNFLSFQLGGRQRLCVMAHENEYVSAHAAPSM